MSALEKGKCGAIARKSKPVAGGGTAGICGSEHQGLPWLKSTYYLVMHRFGKTFPNASAQSCRLTGRQCDFWN